MENLIDFDLASYSSPHPISMTSFKLPPQKKHPGKSSHFATVLVCAVFHLKAAELPAEKILWKGNPGGPAIELDLESVRQLEVSVHSPSGSNRVFSQVSEPSYTINQASKATATGLAWCFAPEEATEMSGWIERATTSESGSRSKESPPLS